MDLASEFTVSEQLAFLAMCAKALEISACIPAGKLMRYPEALRAVISAADLAAALGWAFPDEVFNELGWVNETPENRLELCR